MIRGEVMTKKDIASAIESVGRRLQDDYGNEPIPRREIIEGVVEECGCAPTSVIPSDYCYNLWNKGIPCDQTRFFLHEGERRSGNYRFVGKYFSYDGQILHFPKGRNSDPIEKGGCFVEGKYIKPS